ncbi:MAG: AAA family ATPase, partial [Rhodospirillaceae bacterium]|nr:AAA family ATPase [Rhodospirillaceae bacterium]
MVARRPTVVRAARPVATKAKAPTAKTKRPTKGAAPAPPKPKLVILGGWPGTGKTTLAMRACKALNASHVRVDTAEHALRSSLGKDFELKALGYRVAYAFAEDNLRLGHSVVAD